MKAATAVIILLVGSLLLSSCSSSISGAGKAEARELANAGELFVAWTSLDNIPQQRNPDGTITTTSFGSACTDCKAEIEIRFDKDKVDRDRQPSNQVGKWAICIHKSNPQLQEFLKLKRGERVLFEYTDTPTQTECASGMYVKLVNSLKLGDKAKAIEKRILNDEAVSETDLQGFSATELRILRNVNFARHGRKYDRPGLGDYFFNQAWYKARDDFKDSELTASDKANAKLIQSMESRLAGSPPPSPSDSSSTASVPAPAAPVSLDEEITKVAWNVYKQFFTECGDSYVAGEKGIKEKGGVFDNPHDFIQYKGVTITAQPETLNEADKLNGVEWRGYVVVAYRLVRTHWKNKGWGDWATMGHPQSYSFLKKKGEYKTGLYDPLDNDYKKISCSELPQ